MNIAVLIIIAFVLGAIWFLIAHPDVARRMFGGK